MNRRALWILLGVALAGVALATWYLRHRTRPPLPYEVDADAPVATAPVDTNAGTGAFDSASRGGTYSGTVVEADGGAPIPNARVLLVATDENLTISLVSVDAQGQGPAEDIPVYGSFRIAAEGTTDAKGAFRISGGEARIVALFAYEIGHGPGIKSHMKGAPLKPGPGHVLKLAKAGFVVGTVIDKVTRAPVPGADVSIYLQHRANQDERGSIALTPTSSFAVFQQFITKELGQRIWGIPARENDEALHVFTDRQGVFHLGPIMHEVQLEFVVTHGDYAWTDDDPEVALERDNPGTDPTAKVKSRKRRTVVPPGATVERTFELVRGKEIFGTVVDDKQTPFEDVLIRLEHVAQYSQHYWYRTRTRGAQTDSKGRFHIAGLSYGPYVLTMTHPAFGSKVFQPIKEATDETYVIPRGGWIVATVTGGADDRKDFVAEVQLAKVLARAEASPAAPRRDPIRVKGGSFSIEKVEPGHYDLSMSSGRLVSAPVRVEVTAGEGAKAELSLRSGGGFRVTVTSSNGAPIDPVTAEVEVVLGDGSSQRAGIVISRGGVVEAEGLQSGTYRVAARAQGYMPRRTESFEVATDRMTPVATLTLQKAGLLKILSIKDADGRQPAEGAIRSFTILQGDGSPVAAGALATGTVPVAPGSVVVRVTMEDGRVSETKVEVAEGSTVPVDVVLDPK